MLESGPNAFVLVANGLLVGGFLALALSYAGVRDSDGTYRERAVVMILSALALAAPVFTPVLRLDPAPYGSAILAGGLVTRAAFELGRARSRGSAPPGALFVAAVVSLLLTGGVGVAAVQPDPPGPAPVVTTPTATPTPSPLQRRELALRIEGRGTIESLSGATILCTLTCSATVEAGAVVTLRALPDATTVFAGWSGACTGRGQCDVSAPARVTASFRLPTLSVTTSGSGSGWITSEPKLIECPPICSVSVPRATRVFLDAQPTTSSMGPTWSVPCTADPCALAIEGDLKLDAAFTTRPGAADTALCGGAPSALTVSPGDTRQVTACYVNAGTVTWLRRTATEVRLVHCCPVGSASPYAAWGPTWVSPSIYALMSTASVTPGGQLLLTFQFTVPKTTRPGIYRVSYELALADGTPLRLHGGEVAVTVR